MQDKSATPDQAAPSCTEEAQTGASSSGQDSAGGEVFSRTLLIVNKKGLHARATAKFVQCAESFDCAITVSRCGETVGGDSIMGILTLGAGIGSSIVVTAQGVQAQEAMEAITALVANRFGEDD